MREVSKTNEKLLKYFGVLAEPEAGYAKAVKQ